ncbi:MAG TPA: nicotinate phosphoribosyltransferase [Rhodomicrobium sp.]|nr:nicotinate phosphoribosyltransferase [Rhodomicrobium sp.]
MDITRSALLTDLYELAMTEAFLEHGKTGTAVFEFFARKLPANRGFLVAAGLEQTLDFLENFRFTPENIAWLAQTGRFGADLLDYLAKMRFTGDVHAMPEGTVFFADEPILRVTAPLPEAQLAEARLINILHFQSLIASKAARFVLLAPGKLLVDFGFRRSHGAEAGVMAARASAIAGFAGTATVLAGELFGIPLYGTMAHSFIEAFEDEAAAFLAFAESRPKDLTLLIDTYDTEAAARKVVALAKRLEAKGISIGSVRLDSGDLIHLSKSVRRILDEGGLASVKIFGSGGIDETDLVRFRESGAPIDGFGIGTSLTASLDLPALDCAYKLQEYDGLPRRKRSFGKATWPGRKQVWRNYGPDGRMASDVITLEGDPQSGQPLLQPVMKAGRRIGLAPALADIKARAARDLERLPDPLRRLDPEASYPVTISEALLRLTEETDRRLARLGAKVS